MKLEFMIHDSHHHLPRQWAWRPRVARGPVDPPAVHPHPAEVKAEEVHDVLARARRVPHVRAPIQGAAGCLDLLHGRRPGQDKADVVEEQYRDPGI